MNAVHSNINENAEVESRNLFRRQLKESFGDPKSYLKLTLLVDGSATLIPEKNLQGMLDIPNCKGQQLIKVEMAISKMNIAFGNGDDKSSMQCKFEMTKNKSQLVENMQYVNEKSQNMAGKSKDAHRSALNRHDYVDPNDYMRDIDDIVERLEKIFKNAKSKDPKPKKRNKSRKEMEHNFQLTMKVWRGDERKKEKSKDRRTKPEAEIGLKGVLGDMTAAGDTNVDADSYFGKHQIDLSHQESKKDAGAWFGNHYEDTKIQLSQNKRINADSRGKIHNALNEKEWRRNDKSSTSKMNDESQVGWNDVDAAVGWEGSDTYGDVDTAYYNKWLPRMIKNRNPRKKMGIEIWRGKDSQEK